jgi:hypothetical protein
MTDSHEEVVQCQVPLLCSTFGDHEGDFPVAVTEPLPTCELGLAVGVTEG